MSKMKNIAALLAMAAMFDDGSMFGNGTSIHRPAKEPKPKKDIKPNGLQKFNIDGIEVWAINEKNARRKAAKLRGIS
jgi:hypothetical protein